MYTERANPTGTVLLGIGLINRSSELGPNDQRFRAEDFKFNLGIQENDTVADPKVTSRLLFMTILPRDEKALFRGSTSDLENAVDLAIL